jgi:U1 small nuclear ribonucleoprotein
MKTLFVGKLSYTAREKHLKREFEIFGPVKTVKIIKDNKTDKPRGYAFIEFEHKRDFIGNNITLILI